jgi:rhamnogalacturonan acetylesterase
MRYLILLLSILGTSLLCSAERKPSIYLIGDSTVKNNTKGQIGWGSSLDNYFDAQRITVKNHALGGRSSRSYLREGLWQRVLDQLQPGDFVMIQFGHNDNGPVDSQKARASLKGNTNETREVTIKETGVKETVHSFGWYLRKYANDAKAKGATPIICSLIPRNIFKDEKVIRADEDYGKVAKEAAAECGAFFLPLNTIIADHYDRLGPAKVAAFFTSADHTHTSGEGADFNAQCVVEGLRANPDLGLAKFLLKIPTPQSPKKSR